MRELQRGCRIALSEHFGDALQFPEQGRRGAKLIDVGPCSLFRVVGGCPETGDIEGFRMRGHQLKTVSSSKLDPTDVLREVFDVLRINLRGSRRV